MNKRALLVTSMAFAMTVSTGTSADVYGPNVAAVRAMPTPVTDQFTAELAKQYQSLALFEADQMYDLTSSDVFAQKALAASQGAAPPPERPENWEGLSQQFVPQLQAARSQLVAALDGGARSDAPQIAAEAQVAYDCWLENKWEGPERFPWQPEQIELCQTRFERAMAQLSPDTGPVQPAFREMGLGATVYFDFDKAELRPDAQAELERLVQQTQGAENIVMTVVGHTDRAGPPSYNQGLSERRAAAVRAALLDKGLRVADVSELRIEARGEEDPAVETPPGVAHPMNRRVEVTAYQRVPAQQPPGQVSVR